MSAKKRQTFGKRDRERAVREKRARKQEKKDARKEAAREAEEGGLTGPADTDDEAAPAE